ncbi:MAG: alanine racemase [Myxococcota bacterium]
MSPPVPMSVPDLPDVDRQRARRAQLRQAIADPRDRLATPTLIIDLDAVEHNVAAMLRRVGHPARWRPHIKTVKQPTLVGLMLDAGVHRFKAATPAEVQIVLEAAADRALPQPVDVLLAYPPARPQLHAMLALRAAHPKARLGLLADSPEHLAELVADLGSAPSPSFDLWLDVDLGMRRTGRPPDDWREHPPPADPRLPLVGLHGYDGHHSWSAREPAHAGYDALVSLARALPQGEVEQLCTSGTHSYAHALAHRGLTHAPWDHQVSPGTLVLSDRRSAEAAADLGLRPAAFVLSRVVARPGNDRVTLDAGSKALAPDCPAPGCAVLGEPGLVPLTASEEHRPVLVESGPRPARGDLLWLVPDHVCTTVNLHAEVLYVRTDRVVGSAPVKARGHRPWLALGALAAALSFWGAAGCQPITTDVDVQLLLPESRTELARTNNVSVVLEPEGFARTVATDGLDFGLSFEVPPDSTLRTLSVYLADNDTLLAWGRTPPFRYGSAATGLGVLVAYAGALAPVDFEFAEPDAAVRIAPVADQGALLLSSDGSALFLDAYTYTLRAAQSLSDGPAADDGLLVDAADGGVVRVAWNEGLAAWRFDTATNTWQSLVLEGDLDPRPGATAWVDQTRQTLWLAGGGDAVDVRTLSLLGDEPRALVPVEGAALDGPRAGATGAWLDGRPVLVGDDDPSLAVVWRADTAQAAGPIGAWINLACAPWLEDPPQLLCVGGLRNGVPTADGLRIVLGDGDLSVEPLPDLLPRPLTEPLLLSDGDALYAQGDGHWLRIERDDRSATEQPSACPRGTAGSVAVLPSGLTLLVGGLDTDGAPLDRWYAFAPQVDGLVDP